MVSQFGLGGFRRRNAPAGNPERWALERQLSRSGIHSSRVAWANHCFAYCTSDLQKRRAEISIVRQSTPRFPLKIISRKPLVARTKATYNWRVPDTPDAPPQKPPSPDQSAHGGVTISGGDVRAGHDIVAGDEIIQGDSITGQTVT